MVDIIIIIAFIILSYINVKDIVTLAIEGKTFGELWFTGLLTLVMLIILVVYIIKVINRYKNREQIAKEKEERAAQLREKQREAQRKRMQQYLPEYDEEAYDEIDLDEIVEAAMDQQETEEKLAQTAAALGEEDSEDSHSFLD